ncbi:hypothetical protein GGF43_005575 [Coemansia sp. RSA 2618]|nr:hypothetical protein GGF43_005575 [Coemansia sp. RSA 2618]
MWSYQLYFRRFESVDALDREIPLFLTVLLRSHDEIVETSVMSPRVPVRERTIADARGTTRSSLLSANELAYYVQQYQRQGMLGPTNYYRVDELSAREEREAHIECVVRKPCMMVTVGNDHVLPAEWADGMEKRVPRLMRRHIESAGHWVLVEQKELANAALRAFLDEITSAEAKL